MELSITEETLKISPEEANHYDLEKFLSYVREAPTRLQAMVSPFLESPYFNTDRWLLPADVAAFARKRGFIVPEDCDRQTSWKLRFDYTFSLIGEDKLKAGIAIAKAYQSVLGFPDDFAHQEKQDQINKLLEERDQIEETIKEPLPVDESTQKRLNELNDKIIHLLDVSVKWKTLREMFEEVMAATEGMFQKFEAEFNASFKAKWKDYKTQSSIYRGTADSLIRTYSTMLWDIPLDFDITEECWSVFTERYHTYRDFAHQCADFKVYQKLARAKYGQSQPSLEETEPVTRETRTKVSVLSPDEAFDPTMLVHEVDCTVRKKVEVLELMLHNTQACDGKEGLLLDFLYNQSRPDLPIRIAGFSSYDHNKKSVHDPRQRRNERLTLIRQMLSDPQRYLVANVSAHKSALSMTELSQLYGFLCNERPETIRGILYRTMRAKYGR